MSQDLDRTQQGHILQAILESPRDIVIIALDCSYRYLAFNEAHRRVMKQIWNVDIRVGQNMLEEVVGRDDDRARAKVSFDRALAGERFVVTEEFGDTKYSRRYFEDAYGPILDASGAVIGMTIYLTDVTERKVAQLQLEEYREKLEALVAERTAALQRSEELYRTLVLNAPISAMVHRGDTVLFVNPAAALLLAGGDGQQLVGRRLHDVVAPDVVARLVGGERFTGTEVSVMRRDGGTAIVEWTSIPVELEEMSASFSLLVDVTARRHAERDRQQLEEQMRHTQKLESLGVLAGGIAHDFNNLLVGILGNVDGALRRLTVLDERDPALRTQLEGISLAAKRASELTRRMLAYAGKGAFALVPLDLNALASEMNALLGLSVSKSATLVFELDPDLPPIAGDAAQLRQVLMNLVTNAADAIGERRGRITVRSSVVEVDAALIASMFVDADLEPGSFVCLEVGDTGAGMDATTRASIFDPFFSTKEAGRGLGLAAVLGIVRSHHGGLFVTSEPGQGSVFRVFFPRSAVAVAPTTVVDRTDAGWRQSGIVLIADDQLRVRKVLSMMLSDIGFGVLETCDAEACLEAYRAHRAEIALVIVDLMMPGGGGRAVISALRAAGERVAIIVSSGYSEHEVGKELQDDPRLRFLEKPFDYETLVRTIRGLIAPSDGSNVSGVTRP